MKQRLLPLAKQVFADRWMVGLLLANLVATLVVLLLIGVSIEPKETQVVTQYSSFGITGFYRNYWYTLWSYGALVIVILLGHAAMSAKLLSLERRGLALALLWLTLGIIAIVYLFARSIISIAALG